MTKPTAKTITALDWNECTSFIEKKHNINTRDFAGMFDLKPGNPTSEYQDFWHFICDNYYPVRGGFITLSDEMVENAEEWQKKLHTLYINEFGAGPYHADW